MKISISVSANFDCSDERAFKTPILGDATQYLKGYIVIPPVINFKDDQTWGKPGGTRIPIVGRNLFSKGGEIGLDTVISRQENEYWQWEVTDLKQPMLGINKFEGQYFVRATDNQRVSVKWIYTLHTDIILLFPFQWFFAHMFWKKQMQNGIRHMKKFAESEKPFLYQ